MSIQSMDEFLNEAYITSENIRTIATLLDLKRRENRGRYSKLITSIAGCIMGNKSQESFLVTLAGNGCATLCSLCQDLEQFKKDWHDSVLLMKGLWGTTH